MKIDEFKEKYSKRIEAFKEIRKIISSYREFLYQQGLYSKQRKNGKYKKEIDGYEKQLEKYGKQLKKLRSFISNPRNMLETYFVNILIYYPNIIEWGLKYLNKNYLLGKSNYRGDILFLDSNNKRLNVEVKVKQEQEIRFMEQMTNYLENIDMTKERVMYIAPEITDEQREFCKKNSIEMKRLCRVIKKVILKVEGDIKEIEDTIDCLI